MYIRSRLVMKYLIAGLSLFGFIVFGTIAAYCGYKMWTDDVYWGFVMLAIMLPTAVCLLITQAAFSAVREV